MKAVIVVMLFLVPIASSLHGDTITGRVVNQHGVGMPGLQVSLYVTPGRSYSTISGTDGVFSVSIVTHVRGQAPIPATYSVSENYPNPFNPRTRIEIGLPRSSIVKILLYNVAGQRVGEGTERSMMAGKNSVDLELNGLSNGVYFARVYADDEAIATRKLLLIYGTQHLVPTPGSDLHAAVLQSRTQMSTVGASLGLDSVVVSWAPTGKQLFTSLGTMSEDSTHLGDLVLQLGTFPGGMVLVAGGTFQMGSTRGYTDEQPGHAVTVSSFWLDAKEVTVAQYKAFCTATARPMPSAPPWGWSNDDPVVDVTWNDATAYAAWAGKRLPTEAEWEYAARGGTLNHGYTYSGSNTIGDVSWYVSNSGGRTQPVGRQLPNELGLYDMSGNVWEWCSDWSDEGYYWVSPSLDPKGPSSGTYRAKRGGSFIDVDGNRVAFRGRNHPSLITADNGLRCAGDTHNHLTPVSLVP